MPTLQVKYPTKEQILEKPLKHKRAILALVKRWKKEEWKEVKDASPREKFETIKSLIQPIANFYQKPVNVEFVPDTPIGCHYNPQTNTITIDNRVSIISALHELAHALFGGSEIKACRWSIWLFKKTFPKAYNRLVWDKHMLVKPICPTRQIESPSASTTSSG